MGFGTLGLSYLNLYGRRCLILLIFRYVGLRSLLIVLAMEGGLREVFFIIVVAWFACLILDISALGIVYFEVGNYG